MISSRLQQIGWVVNAIFVESEMLPVKKSYNQIMQKVVNRFILNLINNISREV